MRWTREAIASAIDHTLLRPGATTADIERHCREAVDLGFRGVCLLPVHLRTASRILDGTGVILAAAVAFPHGGSTLLGKVFEALEAVKHGAAEVDVVMNLSAIASGDRSAVEEEVRTLMARVPDCRHKFIVETGLFDASLLEPVLKIMNQRRPAFVKTSTGAGAPGATPEVVAWLRRTLHRKVAVKASGGIRTLAQAAALLQAGAVCLGTSAGVEILREIPDGTPS
jgi:deoxyribose-phosphate aldolase